MSQVNSVSGTIQYIGESTADAQCRTYDELELLTDAGVVVMLTKVMMANSLVRGIKLGSKVSLSHTVVDFTRTIVWAVREESGRVLVNEDLYKVRAAAKASAMLWTFMTLFGYICFFVPGVVMTFPLLKQWKVIGKMPMPEAIKASVAALRGVSAPSLATA